MSHCALGNAQGYLAGAGVYRLPAAARRLPTLEAREAALEKLIGGAFFLWSCTAVLPIEERSRRGRLCPVTVLLQQTLHRVAKVIRILLPAV